MRQDRSRSHSGTRAPGSHMVSPQASDTRGEERRGRAIRLSVTRFSQALCTFWPSKLAMYGRTNLTSPELASMLKCSLHADAHVELRQRTRKVPMSISSSPNESTRSVRCATLRHLRACPNPRSTSDAQTRWACVLLPSAKTQSHSGPLALSRPRSKLCREPLLLPSLTSHLTHRSTTPATPSAKRA